MHKITIIGTGYVGLIASVGLADFGNIVTGVDMDHEKISMLNRAVSPIYELGISDYLKRNLDSGRLTFSTDLDSAARTADVVIIAVGTPQLEDGQADLSFLESAVESIGRNMDGYTIVVTKSTVPVGTNRRIEKKLKEIAPDGDFDVVSNPEFLREGKAIEDFFHPNRIVIGCESERAKEILYSVYRALNVTSVPFVWCSLETAELIKYASNAFLATKITFINQMANLSETVGADIQVVAKAMGMDGRISPYFLHPGPGYGGSCLPKDTKAILNTGERYGVDISLIRSVIEANDKQKSRMVSKLGSMVGNLKGKTIALLGLSFKQQTDDIRESPAISIAKELLSENCKIRAHDPKALENFRKVFPDLDYFTSAYKAAEGADALAILTEWNEYRSLDLDRLKTILKSPVILDTRNVLDPHELADKGFKYQGVGRA